MLKHFSCALVMSFDCIGNGDTHVQQIVYQNFPLFSHAHIQLHLYKVRVASYHCLHLRSSNPCLTMPTSYQSDFLSSYHNSYCFSFCELRRFHNLVLCSLRLFLKTPQPRFVFIEAISQEATTQVCVHRGCVASCHNPGLCSLRLCSTPQNPGW